MAKKRFLVASIFLIALGAIAFLLVNGIPSGPRVVVYCALDREFAESILDDFTRRDGIVVVKRYDTEANKSVGLYDDLIRESSRPRCDVHWNNEILATIRLQRQGVYAPYESPSSEPFPAQYKAADHTWTAFAARARVLIFNTNRLQLTDYPKSLEDLLQPQFQGRVAMAKPFFGTTATHAACLFQVWGADKAKEFFKNLKHNEAQIVPGNKQVAAGVGVGQFDVGLTDTDDALEEIAQQRPVAMTYPDGKEKHGNGLGTLFIPNTVAMVKDCPNPEGARKLIDYLLSQEVEIKLAHCPSRQLPLNPEITEPLPPEVRVAQRARRLPVDFEKAADVWDESQKFLKELFGVR
jgi:iron(III) transport system substrate-binding protein